MVNCIPKCRSLLKKYMLYLKYILLLPKTRFLLQEIKLFSQQRKLLYVPLSFKTPYESHYNKECERESMREELGKPTIVERLAHYTAQSS